MESGQKYNVSCCRRQALKQDNAPFKSYGECTLKWQGDKQSDSFLVGEEAEL